MMGYMTGSNLTNNFGGVESILFTSENGVVLSGDGERTTERRLSRDEFETGINAQKFLVKQAHRPHIVLNEYQQSAVTERLLYLRILKALVDEGASPTTQTTYDTLIEQVERAHPATIATKHPARKTICRHWRTWVISGFNNESLACKKRHTAPHLSAATEALLQHHVATHYSSNHSLYKRAFYNDYKREAEKAAKDNASIKVASQRTYYRRLRTITDEEKRANTKHLSAVELNKHMTTLAGRIKTYYAMQRVECDRVKLNMCLIDDQTGEPTEPISLYVAIDVYTRCPVSVVLSFDAENSSGGLNLLRHLYISDNNLPMRGHKPTALIMDNGPGFNNALMKKAAERMGVDIHYAPSNQPAKKPFIESFFNVLRDNFFSGMKIEAENGTYTIGFQSYVGKRTHKNSMDTIPIKKLADITVSDFKRLLNNYLTEYINLNHRSAKHVPLKAWQQSLYDTPMPSFTYEQLQSSFHVSMDKPMHKLQPRGTVRCLGQDFYSNELKALYKLLKTDMSDGENPSVNVFYDAHDARTITVVTTLPDEDTPKEFLAYNVDHRDAKNPISFNKLNNLPEFQQSIYQTDANYTVTGHYAGNIDSFVRKKASRSPKRGPAVPSFNKNTDAGLSPEDRIKLAHNSIKNKSPSTQKKALKDLDIDMINQTNTLAPALPQDDDDKKLWGNNDE